MPVVVRLMRMQFGYTGNSMKMKCNFLDTTMVAHSSILRHSPGGICTFVNSGDYGALEQQPVHLSSCQQFQNIMTILMFLHLVKFGTQEVPSTLSKECFHMKDHEIQFSSPPRSVS